MAQITHDLFDLILTCFYCRLCFLDYCNVGCRNQLDAEIHVSAYVEVCIHVHMYAWLIV